MILCVLGEGGGCCSSTTALCFPCTHPSVFDIHTHIPTHTHTHPHIPHAPPQLLRFSFNLPDTNDAMQDIAKLLAAAVLFIDVVGQYKLSPEQQKRATKVGVLWW